MAILQLIFLKINIFMLGKQLCLLYLRYLVQLIRLIQLYNVIYEFNLLYSVPLSVRKYFNFLLKIAAFNLVFF